MGMKSEDLNIRTVQIYGFAFYMTKNYSWFLVKCIYSFYCNGNLTN